MNSSMIVWIFLIIGLLIGYYAGNKEFRIKVNGFLKKTGENMKNADKKEKK